LNSGRNSALSTSELRRAQSAFSFYPTTLEEAPTSRWNIDSENDSFLFEEMSRLAIVRRGGRPATSLGLARNDPYLGKHSSEIWGSLSERAKQVAAEKRGKKKQPKNQGYARVTPGLRASSARSPTRRDLWGGSGVGSWHEGESANEGAPRGRQASWWAFHAPADKMLGRASSVTAKRLLKEIDMYRDNSYQRDLLEQRVGAALC
jgi:hypothetical protein